MQLNSKIYDFLRIIPAGLYNGLIWFMSSGPVPFNITGFDKTVHIMEYTILGILLGLGFKTSKNNFDNPARNCLFTGAILGGLDEIHQHFVPGRSMDIFDFSADITGIAAGIIIWIAFLNFMGLFFRKKN